jgi:Flp pilus assembly protein TadG
MTTTSHNRQGTILPLLAVTCFALFGFIALAVDLGMLMVARTECQNAADAAALVGARSLDNNYPQGSNAIAYNNQRPAAITAATNAVKGNYLLSSKFTFSDAAVDKVEIGIYDYDSTYTVFRPTFPATGADPTQKINNRPWTAARVTVKGDQPTYFARIFGVNTMPMSASATAVHRPRDIAMVVDFSGSMRFGSTPNYPPGNGGSSGYVRGLLNPDPRYPQFGHFARYDTWQQTNPNGASPHPFRMGPNAGYIMSSGEYQTPHNLTYDSNSGPPMVNDFFYYPTNSVAVSNPSLLKPAFNNTLPGGVAADQVCPTSANYAQQNIGAGFLGDRSPRKGGFRTTSNTAWDPATTTGAARNVAELLFANGAFPGTPVARTIAAGRLSINITGIPNATAAENNGRTEGATTWPRYYDDAWERNGYDLDIPTYISSNYTTVSARSTEPFTGYTMGPGYWGKSFFTWPPDPRYNASANVTAPASGSAPFVPSTTTTGTGTGSTPAFDTSGRAMCDWRRRFFLKFVPAVVVNGVTTQAAYTTPFNPQVDNINGTLLNATSGQHTLNVTSPSGGGGNSVNGNFRVNYPAVLAWIKSGPQTCPKNLRAGRILYYDAIPDNCTTPANDNERFWREYIDFVLGVTANRTWYSPGYCLAGIESSPWATISQQVTRQFQTTGRAGSENPFPYMVYTDVPNMPKAHFWFGPYSLLMFLSTRGSFNGSGNMGWNYMAGTVREAQCWQVKAGIQSGIEDIRRNHPNDQCGLSYFAYSNYRTPRVAMGQDWDRLRAALFFPQTFLNDVIAGNVREERPYNTSFAERLNGNLPNADGATDPNNGLALAYNMFSLSTSGASGAGGRRGAAKIVVFETDGVPNSWQNWDFSANGTNSKFNWIDAGASPGNGDATSMNEAYSIVQQIAASTTGSAPGYSLPNAPARVYSIAFGDLFTSTSSFKPTALTFLQTVQCYGNALASTSTPLPTEQIITGDYNTRINNMKTCLERIFQNGVQVALIE